ncbi:MAG: TonB-dependent receptor, partial [Pseudomonadota bacterium]
MNTHDGKFSRSLIAVAVGLCAHDLALAAPETPLLEEVVVTATRRAQSVQDVPYNISAIDGQQLKRAGITNMSELTKSIPGVSYVDRGVRSGAFSSGLAMRGISMEDGRLSLPLSTAPTVSTYVDETPLYANFYLSDVERVEVLRGPQGTLYGSGSLGGTLRFIHNKPSTEGLEVEASGDISQTENGDGINYTSGLMLNVPLTDTLAVRGNVGYTDNAGWIDAPALYVRDAGGVPELADPADPLSSPGLFQSQDGINSESTMNARVALRWMPTERFSAQLNYHRQKDESDGAPVQAVNLPGYGDYDSPSLLREPYDGDLELTSLELEYDLGFASVTTSLAHYESDQDFNTDATRLYLNFDFYAYSYGAMPRPAFTDYNENNDKSDVAEIRLTSQSEGPFDWVLGLYYMDQKTEVYNENYFPGYTDWADACADAGLFDCGLGTPLGTFNLIGLVPGQNPPSAEAVGYQVSYDQNYLMDSRSEFTDKAAYGELTWNITDAWQITGGMR